MSFQKEFERITNYDLINQHVKLPNYPNELTFLLFLFLKHFSVRSKDSKRLAFTTSLIYMGIVTHERLPQRIGTEKQVQVLAGDFFSSFFYRYLVKARLFKDVLHLSQCVARLMELKVQALEIESTLEKAIKLDIYLFDSFRMFIREDLQEKFHELLYYTSLKERVEEEHVEAIQKKIKKIWQTPLLKPLTEERLVFSFDNQRA